MENSNRRNRLTVILEAFILMIAFQGIAELAEWLISPFFPDTRFNKKMINMLMMIVLTIILICYAKTKKQTLSFFSKKLSKRYIIATCVTTVLFIIAPSNFVQGFSSVMSIIYGSIVTPVYEELLFRGYVWNRFSKVMSSKLNIFLWNIALFTIWHLFYIIPDMISGNWDVLQLLKLVAGLGYGTILGLIRLKTENCWATILAHGIMNFFMI